MKNTPYFSHDYTARNDGKIKCLLRKHGMIGYGIYWALVEDLYNNANALQLDYEGMSYDLHTTPEIIKSVITEFGLFFFDDENFGSDSISRRLKEMKERSDKSKEAAFIRWEKQRQKDKDKDANA